MGASIQNLCAQHIRINSINEINSSIHMVMGNLTSPLLSFVADWIRRKLMRRLRPGTIQQGILILATSLLTLSGCNTADALKEPRSERLIGRASSVGNTLDPIERLNYGALFTPIEGIYVPTEATYTLMMVMNVPSLQNRAVPWNQCIDNRRGQCIVLKACDVIIPDISPVNRTELENQTCSLISNFIQQLHDTRKTVADDLVDSLQAHVSLTNDDTSKGDDRRSRRDLDTNTTHDKHTHINRTVDIHDFHDLIGTRLARSALSQIKCQLVGPLVDRLTCLSKSAQLQQKSLVRGRTVTHRQTRSTALDSFYASNRMISRLLDDVIDRLQYATTATMEIDTVLKTMKTSHEYHDFEPDRRKRGIFNFGGKILDSLFGIVTDEEISDMRFAIRSLVSNQFKIKKRLETFEKRVVAVANLTNQHMHQMMTMMEKVDKRLTGVISDLNRGYQTSNRFAAFTSSLILALLQDIAMVETEASGFLSGLRSLLNEELTLDLVPEEVLRNALRELNKHLAEEFPAFSVSETNPLYYYKHSKPTFMWKNSTLVICLSVPLSSTRTAFRLFRVSTFGIPTDYNDTLITRPIIEKDVFGISHDNSRFLEMKRSDLESCNMAQTIRCQQAAVIHDVYHTSCLLALFQNDQKTINQYCSYRLEATKPILNIQPLSPGRLLISNAHTVSVGCPSRALAVRDGCKMCIWHQPCNCYVTVTDKSSRSLTVTPVIHGCKAGVLRQRVEFPVNIPALSRLLEPSALLNLSYNAYVQSIRDVPRLKIDIHPLAKRLNIHENYEFSMELDEAVQQLRQDSTLNPLNLDPYLPDKNKDWLTYVPLSLIISLVVILLVTSICFCHRKGWFRFSRKEVIETPNNSPNLNEEGVVEKNNVPDDGHRPPAFAPSPYNELRGQVAMIITEYADEVRNTGTLPASTVKRHFEQENTGTCNELSNETVVT